MKYKFSYVFSCTLILFVVVVLFALFNGKLGISSAQFWHKITTGHDNQVDAIIDLRLPRIIVAICAGAALSVAGAYLQAVLKNPLADASIIGVSSGALVAKALVMTFIPTLFFYMPVISFIGGLLPFILLFYLQHRYQLNPMRMLLVGVSMYAMLNGVLEYLTANPAVRLSAGLSLKVWKDAAQISVTTSIGLILAMTVILQANMLGFDDRQAHNLGFPIQRYRMLIGLIAVFLASSAVAVAGAMAFVGLIVPHIARRLVGSDYRKVVLCCVLFGAIAVLLADTLGRLMSRQFEVPAHIITVIIGGPYLIYLICKGAYRNEYRQS
ncbi:FecCD family ABC transporter permease [Staphylococcus simulans]|uniref:FecCD family ABC transporter permease n=1 Tax=Staphylococcus simulans TaxID=1286 RepID=UPI000D1E764E|nr:iron ABC transporter permease [Staphylococcus simulans]MDY5059161.1 iron ABC transporter permease [Staphylococcus simulans]PTJ16772.1 heme ABC transporter permease [Staphylococcus simulans]